MRQLMAVPLKDLVVAAAWAHGLFHDQIRWRGHHLRVLPGTRLEPPDATVLGGRPEEVRAGKAARA